MNRLWNMVTSTTSSAVSTPDTEDPGGFSLTNQSAQQSRDYSPISKIRQSIAFGIHEFTKQNQERNIPQSQTPTPGQASTPLSGRDTPKQMSHRQVPPKSDIAHLTAEEISILQRVFEKQEQFEKEAALKSNYQEPGKRAKGRTEYSCRVCLKCLASAGDNAFRICSLCQQRICEDCASYSKPETHLGTLANEDKDSWRCSICRRKQNDPQTKILAQLDTNTQQQLHRNPSRKLSTAIALSALTEPTVPSLSRKPSWDGRSGFPVSSVTGIEVGTQSATPAVPLEPPPPTPKSPARRMSGRRSPMLRDPNGNRQAWSEQYPDSASMPHDSATVETYRAVPPLRHAMSDSQALLYGERRFDALNTRYGKLHSSPSDSSMEGGNETDDPNSSLLWRRRRSKKRRSSSRVSQQSYDDNEPDSNSDPLVKSTSSLRSNRSIGGGDIDVMPKNLTISTSTLDVPLGGSRTGIRHHSWDYSSSVGDRRRGSESSDVSDTIENSPISPNMKVDLRLRELDNSLQQHQMAPMSASTAPRSPRTPRSPKNMNNIKRSPKPSCYDDDYDGELSGAVESSPSPEAHERGGYFKHHDTRKSFSDATEAMQGNFNRENMAGMGPRKSWPGPMPVVAVEGEEVVQTPAYGMCTLAQQSDLMFGTGRSLPRLPAAIINISGPSSGNSSVSGSQLINPQPRTRPSKSIDLSPFYHGSHIVHHPETQRRSTLPDFDRIKIVVDDVDASNLAGAASLPNSLSALSVGSQPRRTSIQIIEPPKEMISKAPPISPSFRRKLPRIPSDGGKQIAIPQSMRIAGEVQLQLWYRHERQELVVTIVCARNLAFRTEAAGSILPCPFAKLTMLSDFHKAVFTTTVFENSVNPVWKTSFVFVDTSSDDILDKFLQVTVWDQQTSKENRTVFMGEAQVDLSRANLGDEPEWHKLHEAKPMIPPVLVSPSDVRELFHTRSMSSEDREENSNYLSIGGNMVKSSSVDISLLHPEDLWQRRRSSSGSENSEISVRSFPRSLPTSRKNSIVTDPLLEEYQRAKERNRSKSFKLHRQDTVEGRKGSISGASGGGLDPKRLQFARSLSLKSDDRFFSLGTQHKQQRFFNSHYFDILSLFCTLFVI